jgi:putative ABC transport system substrate-binding protein
MKAWGRVACVGPLIALALAACSSSSHSTYRIAILRAVPATSNEGHLYDGLARGGVPRGRVRVIGGANPKDAHRTAADAAAAVRQWVKEGVDAIVALSTTGADAARKVAPNVPVLFLSTDPVATGLVRDERHPEGRLTGMAYRVPSDRTLSVVTDAFAGVHHIGCVYPPNDPAAVPTQADLARGAEALGLELTCSTFTGPNDAGDAVRSILSRAVDAVVLVNSPTTTQSLTPIQQAFAGSTTPVIANSPVPFAELLLEPDGTSVDVDLGRQLARVLRGAKITDVPVQDPSHYLLVVNQTIARQHGHVISSRVLQEATSVIGA